MCVFLCVTKDFTNCWTDMVLLYNEAPLYPGKIYNYFGGGYLHPPKKNRPLTLHPPQSFSIKRGL